MEFTKIMSTFLILSSLSGQTFALGGSGIGGGVDFAIISWCDDASIMVSDTRQSALDKINYDNDKLGALRVFYEGLVAAASSSQNTEVKPSNSLTYRSIIRGVKTAQLLGIPSIINGGQIEDGLQGENKIQGLLSYMDWYTLQIQKVANSVDRPKYSHSSDISQIEDQEVQVATSYLSGMNEKFVRLKSDNTSFYTIIPVTQFLRSLSYLSGEVASDLNGTVFSTALDCHSKRLVRLSRNIQAFLDGRITDRDDAIKLNRFILELRTILNRLEAKTCDY